MIFDYNEMQTYCAYYFDFAFSQIRVVLILGRVDGVGGVLNWVALVILEEILAIPHINSETNPLLQHQCCLQVSETVSWYKLRRCYSANIIQHWVGGGDWFISAKWTIPEFSEIFPGIELVSIIYVRFCIKIWGS